MSLHDNLRINRKINFEGVTEGNTTIMMEGSFIENEWDDDDSNLTDIVALREE